LQTAAKVKASPVSQARHSASHNPRRFADRTRAPRG
jgi:hypothetical protein